MNELFLKSIKIDSVRHLKNIIVPISEHEKKHLVITGKNGSGKTSLLVAISKNLDCLTVNGDFKTSLEVMQQRLMEYETRIQSAMSGIELCFNVPEDSLKSSFTQGEFVLAYYEASRIYRPENPKHVEKISLKDSYGISESPRSEFVKYLVDLKMTEALARTSGKDAKAEEIKTWFDNFESVLKKIFDDETIKLIFDEETFAFSIAQNNRNPFGFNELSDGFAAILDIVVDLMVRMQNHVKGQFSFNMPGIVLIDEIETHLHLELQKTVMDLLFGLFPNVQFIVSTHSPFVLSSVKDAVIYDLENKTLVKNGLCNLPYDGIVKSYFEVDDLSRELREKYNRYKELVSKQKISDNEMVEIGSLELYLDEIPDYLALEITTEYRRLKMEFANREDL